MALRIESETPFKDWLQEALMSLRELVNAPRDADELEISQTAISQAEQFLTELARVVKTTDLQPPYVGAGYNGQVVIGWVNHGDRIDLEFYENDIPSAAAIYDGSNYDLGVEVSEVAAIVRKICRVA